jgi:hypothetical protein
VTWLFTDQYRSLVSAKSGRLAAVDGEAVVSSTLRRELLVNRRLPSAFRNPESNPPSASVVLHSTIQTAATFAAGPVMAAIIPGQLQLLSHLLHLFCLSRHTPHHPRKRVPP